MLRRIIDDIEIVATYVMIISIGLALVITITG